MTTLECIIGDKSISIIDANGRKVYLHLSHVQIKLLIDLRNKDFRRRAFPSLAYEVGNTRSERRLSGQRLTPKPACQSIQKHSPAD